MNTIRLIIAAFCLSFLSSCGLLNSFLKMPATILGTVVRTVGITRLTDEGGQAAKSGTKEDTDGRREPDVE